MAPSSSALTASAGGAGGAPRAPRASNITEFTLDLQWEAVQGATAYKVIQRKIPDEWSAATTITISDPKKTSTTIEALEPTSTYQFKIVAVTSAGDSEPSPETTVDTMVGNCTPKPKQCVIQ